MSKKEKKGGKAVKTVAGTGIVALLLALGLNFGFGGGIGLGSGNGQSDKNNNVQTEQNTDSQVTEATQEASKDTQESTEAEQNLGAGQIVTVKIKENEVYVGDKKVETAEELKSYIEEINKDGMEYWLNEENSILETHEWVIEVFEELQLQLVIMQFN